MALSYIFSQHLDCYIYLLSIIICEAFETAANGWLFVCGAHKFVWTLSNQTNGRVLLFLVSVLVCMAYVWVSSKQVHTNISAHAAQTQLKYLYVYTFSFIFGAMFSSFIDFFFHSTFYKIGKDKEQNRNKPFCCCSHSIAKQRETIHTKSHHHLQLCINVYVRSLWMLNGHLYSLPIDKRKIQ